MANTSILTLQYDYNTRSEINKRINLMTLDDLFKEYVILLSSGINLTTNTRAQCIKDNIQTILNNNNDKIEDKTKFILLLNLLFGSNTTNATTSCSYITEENINNAMISRLHSKNTILISKCIPQYQEIAKILFPGSNLSKVNSLKDLAALFKLKSQQNAKNTLNSQPSTLSSAPSTLSTNSTLSSAPSTLSTNSTLSLVTSTNLRIASTTLEQFNELSKNKIQTLFIKPYNLCKAKNVVSKLPGGDSTDSKNIKIALYNKSNPLAYLIKELEEGTLGVLCTKINDIPTIKITNNGQIRYVFYKNKKYNTNSKSVYDPATTDITAINEVITSINDNIDNITTKPSTGGNKKRTKERITYNNKEYNVYVGQRGGKYIKKNKNYINIKSKLKI
jgi:hypothetical protein